MSKEIPEAVLDASWAVFVTWVRSTIGGSFIWKARPRDTRKNRKMVAESVLASIEKNNGTFPQHNAFIEINDK